ncbi:MULTISPECIES: TauD/TfdA family dioxygenase [Streptomyces]|uniref:TauD/TfdA family dioxygenase n=1 Tax=Streptomyces ramulosus TaxID=47762 RepID=A0ABW1FBI0_9ACTN
MASPPSPPLPVPLLRVGRPPVLPVEPSGDPAHWAARHRDALRALVTEHGALLVRGLGLRDAAGTAAVFAALSDDLMAETESFAPRSLRAPGTYTTTPWPPNQQMCPHHELSYATEFPGLMLFACLTEPDGGGETVVADASAVLDALPRRLVRRFARQGWLLTRTYNDEIGASVAEAFGTDDRAAVAEHCRTHAIAHRWHPDGTLRTRQRRSAVVRHPVTGRRCWFNQVAFLNEWTLAPDIREYLVDSYGPDGLPFNTRYGNGDPLEPETVELLNDVYQALTRRTPWRSGDLLLVDNVRTAHGREPFHGRREILVALADRVSLTDCSPTIEVTAA